jgi:hypothetical protein
MYCTVFKTSSPPTHPPPTLSSLLSSHPVTHPIFSPLLSFPLLGSGPKAAAGGWWHWWTTTTVAAAAPGAAAAAPLPSPPRSSRRREGGERWRRLPSPPLPNPAEGGRQEGGGGGFSQRGELVHGRDKRSGSGVGKLVHVLFEICLSFVEFVEICGFVLWQVEWEWVLDLICDVDGNAFAHLLFASGSQSERRCIRVFSKKF